MIGSNPPSPDDTHLITPSRWWREPAAVPSTAVPACMYYGDTAEALPPELGWRLIAFSLEVAPTCPFCRPAWNEEAQEAALDALEVAREQASRRALDRLEAVAAETPATVLHLL